MRVGTRSKSARGLAHSKTLARITLRPAGAQRLGVRAALRRSWLPGATLGCLARLRYKAVTSAAGVFCGLQTFGNMIRC